MVTQILKEDLDYIFNKLTEREKKYYNNKNILITGYAGSIGYLMLEFFRTNRKELGVKNVYGIDNYVFGKPEWIKKFELEEGFHLLQEDIITCDLSFAADADLIFHMASLASPVYYRLHPIETMDADVIGIRQILDFYKGKDISNILFLSTSEIYGNPDPTNVHTKETYYGNVNYHNVYDMPIVIIRPFNSYGSRCGYGGYCRTEDANVLNALAKSKGLDTPILENVIVTNDNIPSIIADHIEDAERSRCLYE